MVQTEDVYDFLARYLCFVKTEAIHFEETITGNGLKTSQGIKPIAE
jgi:hypothetical protein